MKGLYVNRCFAVWLVALSVTSLAGCAVGPDFHEPEPPATQTYDSQPLPEQTAAAAVAGGAAQRFMPNADVPAQWWTLFHSDALERLVRQGLTRSPTLAAARATLRAAQEDLNAAVGGKLYPSIDANVSAARQKTSGAAFGQPNLAGGIFSLYDASVDVSYALDVFGGARRALEGLRAQIDFQRFQLEGATLTLAANIVTTAVRAASLHDQISATEEILAVEREQLDVAEQQLRLGAVAGTDVLALRAQLAQSRATLPPLQKALAQTRHQLDVLIGTPPSQARLPALTLDQLRLPRALPVSLPSALVRQRPDVRAAEAQLHQANAEIGVASANRLPQFSLSASYGSEATSAHDLFSAGTGVWRVAGDLLAPIFHGGELNARRRAAVALRDRAAAQYRATVLQAFQNVADVLRALAVDADALRAQADAEAAARELRERVRRQYRIGAASYLALLDAERQHQRARIGRVQAQAARFADTAALYQALGGGWWNRTASGQNESSVKD